MVDRQSPSPPCRMQAKDSRSFFPHTAAPDILERIRQAGGVVGSLSALDIARVELGRPEWGADMDEGTIPQEANFDELDAISYTKGCYTGQETVARIHFRGHVNRHLRGLRLTAGGPMPPLRAGLVDAGGVAVGDVRSVVHSPRYGLIALAMIRREVEVGADAHGAVGIDQRSTGWRNASDGGGSAVLGSGSLSSRRQLASRACGHDAPSKTRGQPHARGWPCLHENYCSGA